MQINVSYHIMNNNSSVYGFLIKRHLSVYHEQEPYNHIFCGNNILGSCHHFSRRSIVVHIYDSYNVESMSAL